MRRGLPTMIAAYAAALAAAALAWTWLEGHEPWARAAAGGLASTLVLFAVGAARGNPSVFDPYWSVAPMVAAAAWAGCEASAPAVPARQVLVLALVCAWGLRLTYHWWCTWAGPDHEDWRYTDMRRGSGRWFPLVNLIVIHVLPAGMLGLACMAMYPALVVGTRPLGWLDAVAAAWTIGAVLLEATADRHMRAFRADVRAPGEVCERGPWAWSRHPNYLGELSFWWGLALCSLASGAANGWTLAGPLVITGLLVGYSAPALDRRMLARYPAYADYVRRVPQLIPRAPRG